MCIGRTNILLLLILPLVVLGSSNYSHAEQKCLTYDDFPMEFLVLSGEVHVKVVFTRGNFDERKPEGKDSCIEDDFESEIIVSKRDKTFKTQWGYYFGPRSHIADFQVAAAEIQRRTAWKDGYLFVPASCGTGNRRRCNIDCAFAVRQGELVKFGCVVADDTGPGGSYRNGVFYDIDCQLEGNNLTSFASAPTFRIIKKEKNGKLIVDLEKTCANYKDWEPPERLPMCKEQETRPADRDDSAKGYLLWQVGMARYCGRPGLVERWMDVAKCRFGKKTFELFQDEIARVQPPEYD